MSGEVWRIEKIVPGGAGLARLDGGLIGFAEGALPGETILVEGRDTRKGHVRARSFRVLEAAASRVEPPCAYARAGCGCDFMHVSPDTALALKVDVLRDALTRIGKFDELPAIALHASAETLAYRSRIRVHITRDGRVGYHARGSHHLLEIAGCPVARPELEWALQRFREITREHALGATGFSEAELRVAPQDPRPLCCLRATPGRGTLGARNQKTRGARTRKSEEAFLTALNRDFEVFAGAETKDYVQRWPIAEGVSLMVPPQAFVQVNWAVNLRMITALVRGAERAGAKRFLDLYAGAGNFTLALLAAGLTGVAIESEPEATRAALRALAEQGLSGGQVLHGDSQSLLSRRPSLADVDLVVLDPPRAGAKELLAELVPAHPRTIAYFSCDPVTLARDLERVTRSGYALESLAVFDMFPGTHHVETLAWLRQP